jgi:hypothetical protein
MWGHVDWLNPTPVAGDGLTDMILLDKGVVPEFPLGIGMLMAIAPMIAIAYVWRLRKKHRQPAIRTRLLTIALAI